MPDSWVERLFQKFEDFYGAKWAAQYGNFPRERVKRTWGEELAGFADMPAALRRAVEAQKESQFPPTLPEFLALCRDAARRIGTSVPSLPYHPTEEEQRKAGEVVKSLAKAVSGVDRIRDGIDWFWATHPKSRMHLRFIFDAAKNDHRFKPCVAEMVEKGIIDQDGKWLKRYVGCGEWGDPKESIY